METTSCVKFLKSYKENVLCESIKEIEKIDYDLRTALNPFLPKNALDEVVAMLQKYPISLEITPCLKGTMRGMFHYDINNPHIIYIINSLDKDTFLRVFLHEYAHLLTHLTFPNVGVHDREFLFCFCKLINIFFKKKIISEDLQFFNFKGFRVPSGHYQIEKTWKSNEYHKQLLSLLSGFPLKTIRIGSQFEYQNEIFVRGKGQQGKIRCTRVSDGMIFQLDMDTLINPVLDLEWGKKSQQ